MEKTKTKNLNVEMKIRIGENRNGVVEWIEDKEYCNWSEANVDKLWFSYADYFEGLENPEDPNHHLFMWLYKTCVEVDGDE